MMKIHSFAFTHNSKAWSGIFLADDSYSRETIYSLAAQCAYEQERKPGHLSINKESQLSREEWHKMFRENVYDVHVDEGWHSIPVMFPDAFLIEQEILK